MIPVPPHLLIPLPLYARCLHHRFFLGEFGSKVSHNWNTPKLIVLIVRMHHWTTAILDKKNKQNKQLEAKHVML